MAEDLTGLIGTVSARSSTPPEMASLDTPPFEVRSEKRDQWLDIAADRGIERPLDPFRIYAAHSALPARPGEILALTTGRRPPALAASPRTDDDVATYPGEVDVMKVEVVLAAKGRDVETTTPDAEMRLVIHKMTTLGIGALVVSPDGRKVTGTVSERDVVRAINKHGAAVLDLHARDVMSRNTPTCSPDDLLQQVMAQMTRTRHRHVPVVDDDGNLCGIVSIGDVVKRRLDEMELEASVLRDAYIARR